MDGSCLTLIAATALVSLAVDILGGQKYLVQLSCYGSYKMKGESEQFVKNEVFYSK